MDKGRFGRSSEEARSRVGEAKTERNSPLSVRDCC